MKLAAPCTCRKGLSLLEVLVALAIFLFALVAIGRLITFGADRALDLQQRVQANQLCQSKMAEVIAGALPLSPQNDVVLEEDPDWVWSIDAQQADIPGLWSVTVRVTRVRSDGTRIEDTLSQMVLDPSIRGSSADAAASATSSESASTDATSSASSQTSQGTGATGSTRGGTSAGGVSGGTAGTTPSTSGQGAGSAPRGGR